MWLLCAETTHMFQRIQQILFTNLSLTLDPPGANFVNSKCRTLKGKHPKKTSSHCILATRLPHALHPENNDNRPVPTPTPLPVLCPGSTAQQHMDQAIDSGSESYAKIIHFRALWIFLCFFNPSTCEFRICVVNMFGSSISIGKRVKQKTHDENGIWIWLKFTTPQNRC